MMIIKLYVFLSHIKEWDNNLMMEVKMSDPAINHILFSVILFVILMRIICHLQIIYLKHEARKHISVHKKNRKTHAGFPASRSLLATMNDTSDKRNKMIVWVYDISSHQFRPLCTNGFLQSNLTYETGLLLIHPDDRKKYIKELRLLTFGIQDKITVLLRFYCDGRYEMFRYHAIAVKSADTGKVDKIIGTEEYISWYSKSMQ